jgi:hypothetical protein
MRSTVIIVCIFSYSTLLASWEAQALDVNQACNGDSTDIAAAMTHTRRAARHA